MKKIFFLLSFFVALMAACNQQAKETKKEIQSSVTDDKTTASGNFIADNKNDLCCGMPLTTGIGDTAHYNGKIYGFCSKGCKDKFLKDPKSYLAKTNSSE